MLSSSPYLGLVGCDELDVALVVRLPLLLGFNRVDDAEGSAARADDVLVRDREEVALLEGEVLGAALRNPLHVLDHLLVALGLLGELRHVHVVTHVVLLGVWFLDWFAMISACLFVLA